MMIDFVDSSVLIAASTPSDPRSLACRDILIQAKPGRLACSTHSLAEIFSILSGRPRPLKLAPAEVIPIVEHVCKTIKLIELTREEYLKTIRQLAKSGNSGGIIYDALLLACARKAKARDIYTLNQRHFRLIAPDLASRIKTP